MSLPLGSPLGQARLHELAGDPLHAFFSSSIIADFPAGHENRVPDQVVVAPSQEASGVTSEMPADGG
jgi:hypothetical protein